MQLIQCEESCSFASDHPNHYQTMEVAMSEIRPGPWHVGAERDGRLAVVYDTDGFEVAKVCYPNRDANARLIAEAPTAMRLALKALEVELEGHDGPVPHIDDAMAALRKALGVKSYWNE